jgi:hypothetical protein
MGGGLGKFIDVKAYFHSKVDTIVVKILVATNLWEGLLEEMEVV